MPAAPPADPTAEALPFLQARYIDFTGLHYKVGDKLSDLAARSNGKISLITPGTVVPTPILTAALPDEIAYCRLGSFTPKKDWAGLAADLNAMTASQHVLGVVLDLRGNASDDYAGAAQVLGFLVPADTSLLKYVPPPKAGAAPPAPIPTLPHLDGPFIVLTNGQTAGAGEALAGRLQSDGALVVGRATAGTRFEEDKLADGEILRFAMVFHRLPGDTMTRPVTPDIAMTVDDRNEKAALMLIREDHVQDVIQEQAARKRMSEASLVNGQDPEWDAYLATLEQTPVLLSLPRIHDPVLVTALDSVRAIRLSGSPMAEPAEGSTGPAAQAAANDAKPANTSVQ
ncbi:MAG TPA: S41 family peptidase [Opitutaceae bacterium]|nr:S41 family peptidase [Opitutaceae bacterium]